jgi:iron complex transport system substrate-binding protein
MMVQISSKVLTIGGLLPLVILAVVSCERTPPPPRPAPVAASFPSSDLRDWTREPLIDPSEQAPVKLRIVSAAPNVTEICCALGLRSALVGRTRYCDYPPEVQSVPAIGALIDVNVEVLLELRPDLILVSGTSRAQSDRFAALNLRFEPVPDDRLDDLFVAIRRIGELTGRTRTAERLCAGINRDLARVTARFAEQPSRRVLLLIGTLSDPPRPPYVAGPGSFYDDLLKHAGHENVVADVGGAFAPLSLEFILRSDPDVIIELDADGKAIPGGDADARRIWAKVGRLRAVENNRVHVLTGSQHFLLGPRIALTYDALCRTIAENEHE